MPGEYHDQQSSGEAQLTFTNDLVKAVGGVFYMDSTACGDYNASIGVLAVPDDLYLTSIVTGCRANHQRTAVYGRLCLEADRSAESRCRRALERG